MTSAARWVQKIVGFLRVPGCSRGGGVPGEPEGFRLGRLGNLRDLKIREDSGNHPLSLRILLKNQL